MVVMKIGLGMALALFAPAICVVGSEGYDDVVLVIDSGASRHLMSDISLMHYSDACAGNVSSSTAAGTMITSRAVGMVE